MKKRNLSSALIVLLPLGFWICGEVYHAKSSSAAGLAIFSEYREKLPEPRYASALKKGELEYVAYYGPITGFALVSGPPVYVFDSSGKLVDWSRDSGDDPRFAEKWKPLESDEIKISEADDLLSRKQ